MKLTIKKVIDVQTLLMWAGLFCVVSFALLEHMSIPIPEVSSVKMPLVLIGGICVIPLFKIFFTNIRKKRYFYIFLTLLALCACLMVSMKYNSDTVSGYSPERSTIRLVLYLLELFVLMMAFAEKGKTQAAIKFVYYYVLLLVVLTDALMFTGLVTFGTRAYPAYLVGTKFTVVYMHFNLLVLWAIQHREKYGEGSVKKWFVWTAAALVVVVAIYVDCMSGVLGSAFLLWLMAGRSSSRKRTKLLTLPAFFVTCILVCTLIAFVIGFFVSIPFVTSFIENVLGRDTTLTGRINIYLNYVETMQDHWLLGFGYGSGNLVSMQAFRCANAQNAVLHWILQSGLLVSSLLIALFALIMKQVNTHRKKQEGSIGFLVALVYTYIILGIVETTYSMAFILFMALLFAIANDQKEQILTNAEKKRS